MYFVAELSEVPYVLTSSTSSLPIPSSRQAFAPTAPPRLILPSYRRATLSLIHQADLSPQLTCLALYIGHSWSFPPQFTFFPWLPGRNIGCFLLLRSLIAPSQSPFIHSFSYSLPFNVIMPQSSVLFNLVGLNTTYMPTTPKCKLPAQSVFPDSTLPTQNLHLRVQQARNQTPDLTHLPLPVVFLISGDNPTYYSICSDKKKKNLGIMLDFSLFSHLTFHPSTCRIFPDSDHFLPPRCSSLM